VFVFNKYHYKSKQGHAPKLIVETRLAPVGGHVRPNYYEMNFYE
jgi:hypothetical protein